MEANAPRLVLQELIQNSVVPQALYVVATLGIADVLGDETKTARELAAATDADPRSVDRILRLLTAVDVFQENPAGSYRLSRLGGYLRRDVPGSLRSMALAYGQSPFWQVWAGLLHSVRTGEPAFAEVFGRDIFDYYPLHLDEARLFDDLMTDLTSSVAPTVAEAYDFTSVASLVDVGGGNGQMLASILRAHPHLRGVLFDLPHVVAGASALLEAAEVRGRVDLITGDAFTGVPAGHDAYLLSRVIHDWEDELAIELLASCRRAMRESARLLLVERVLPKVAPPLHMLQSDVIMLVAPGGRERTEDEYRQLLAAAGFDLVAHTSVLEPYALLEAQPRATQT